MEDTAEFLKKLKHVKDVELLPYHRLGLEMYERLGRVYELKGIETPGMEEMRKMAEIIQKKMPGCKVKIKGELYTENT